MKTLPVLCIVLATAAAPAAEDTTATLQGWVGAYTENLSRPMLVALDIERGVLVTDLAEGSPARDAGFQTGDIILELDGQPVEDGQALRVLVRERPDRKVTVSIRRRGQAKKLSAAIGVRSEQAHPAPVGFPGLRRILEETRRALRSAGTEIEKKVEHAVPFDSLRKELEALRLEIDQLKEQLKRR